MGLGLVVMVVGVGIQSSTSYHSLICPSISSPWCCAKYFRRCDSLAGGARAGGHEQMCDRYWWVRHYDKRCRRSDNRRHS
ncbi:hypothetical protein DMH88_18640 [Escherichia coli]|nr:hypothetical protein [Escherichia coli]